MNSHYLFLNSKVNDFNKNNVFLDFTSVFHQNINLNDKEWELGLCEIYLDKKTTESTVSNRRSLVCPLMFVCCDIITPSFFNSISIHALRLIPEMIGKNYKNFDKVYYFDVTRKNIDKIRIYIKTAEEETRSFTDQTLYCTVHLREKIIQNEIY